MNEKYMELAFKESIKAKNNNEVPVGAVIVKNNKIVSKAYNTREKTHMISNHAEIIALNKAGQKLKTWKLNECDIYVTLEPCKMCLEAIKQSRIENIYCGIKQENKSNKNLEIKYIKINDKYKEILQNFFKKMRK